MQQRIWIEYGPLSKLLTAKFPGNPKSHAITDLLVSMERFGFTSPVMQDETTGCILAGHGRLESLQQRKEAGQPPPDRIYEQDGEWMVPILRGVGFPSDGGEARAYVLADNRLTELGNWDQEALDAWLKQMATEDIPLDGTGFTAAEVAKLLEEPSAPNPTAPDAFPEFDEDIPTDHQCPKCGYQWSGKKK
ncbi:hypothetical protein [Deinococcus misasensis]|uniref:hypothetical protein n=1 Tax=Deinococcus misasensis TaxID=392413 RepID=UPI00068D5B38|nr:hypothetical protein [Deinococcus misasensis]